MNIDIIAVTKPIHGIVSVMFFTIDRPLILTLVFRAILLSPSYETPVDTSKDIVTKGIVS